MKASGLQVVFFNLKAAKWRNKAADRSLGSLVVVFSH
jgi:hypothetical protein